MFKVKAFAVRNIKELMRDPLSYIFCLGFPIVMLVVMTLVNESIPEEAGMTIFRIDNLAGGIAVFGQTFIMLFTALTVSKDRSGAFLIRMYASPMRSADFIGGYILPMTAVSAVQTAAAFAAALIISLITKTSLNILGLLAAVAATLPSAVMFIGFGLLFGSLFSEKSAPGLCALIISLGSFLGGIWFDAESTGGVMLKLCKSLPFWYCTKTARSAVALDLSFDEFLLPLIIVLICATAVTALAALSFKSKMKADLS
ncbi:MAG: ABC transporter permease [Ruminococcus sp.]|nr:ABC transporter permease [Ruminococcus sp.]